MKKQIKISLHPIFTIISSMYLLIFFTYGVKCLKSLSVNHFQQNDILGLIISVLALSFFMYLVLVRYRKIEVHENKYILKSIVASRVIYTNEIVSVQKVPVNFFNYRLGSIGVMGLISLTSSGESYNISDMSNTLRVRLKNNEVLHISCDNPEELKV